MQVYSTSATRLAHIPEVTENTTPTTPAFNKIRFTGESLTVKRDTVRSQEMNPNRNVIDTVTVSQEASGGFQGEFADGALEGILPSIMWADWSTDVLVNGVTPFPQSFEVTYIDPVAGNTFKRFTGSYVNQFSLDVKPAAIATWSAEIMGRGASYSQTAITGATYVDPSSEPVMTSVDFGSITLGALSVTCIQSLSMNINNNLRAQRCLGDLAPGGIGFGDFEVTGQFEAFLRYSDFALLQNFINSAFLSTNFVLGDTTLKKTKFNMPKFKITNLDVKAESANRDVLVQCDYRAHYDSGIGGTLEITRNLA